LDVLLLPFSSLACLRVPRTCKPSYNTDCNRCTNHSTTVATPYTIPITWYHSNMEPNSFNDSNTAGGPGSPKVPRNAGQGQTPNAGQGLVPVKRAHNKGVQFLFVFISLIVICGGIALALKTLFANSPSEMASRVKPATDLIYTDYTATLTSPQLTWDTDKLQEMLDDARGKGALASDASDDDQMHYLVTAVVQSPGDYLIKSDPQTAPLEVEGFGSGFNLTSDGYVVTNAHVVVIGEDVKSLMKDKQDDAEKAWITNEATQFGNLLPKAGMSDDDIEALLGALKTIYDAGTSLGDIDAKVYVLKGSTDPDSSNPLDKIPCTVEAVGNPYPDKDVAILKMYTNKSLPVLPLAPDVNGPGGLQIGDKLFVFGFPAIVTFDPNNATSSVTDPTMTMGSVERIVPTTAGWDTIQTDTPIYHGNSGGPALNASGQVVGIATFGSIDPNTGQDVGGFNSLMPVDLIREFAHKAGAPIN
jgi:serine protease Do